jgi:hypothetical protein
MRYAALRSSLVALLLPAVASAAEITRKVVVPDHGAFEISLPAEWRYSTEPSPGGGGDTLKLEPAQGERFVLYITAAWVPESNRDAAEAAKWMRVRLHNQTVEEDIPVQAAKGTRNAVHWFRATNKNPTPGEHEAMIQGAAIVGELMVGFTMLHHPGNLPEKDTVLKALGAARHLAKAD